MATKKSRKASPTLDALIFIDTNIFLDFYRVRGWESGLSVLDHITSNLDRIITGDQIEMEYKKNRQRVILDSLGRTKSPDWGALSVPTFLQESKPNKALERAKKQVDSQMKRMRTRIERILTTPGTNDPVFRVAQDLFRNESPFNLSREKDARYNVRRLAMKRFMLGYPPRKEGDTSIGDAINWEWIIRCAADSGKDVIIVSRDSDYGHSYQKTPVLNDWLRQEFAERTSRRRKLLLTDRLTDAFKRIAVAVTPQEEEQETELISKPTDRVPDAELADILTRILSEDERRVVHLSLGLYGAKEHSWEEIASAMQISTAEVHRHFRAAAEKFREARAASGTSAT